MVILAKHILEKALAAVEDGRSECVEGWQRFVGVPRDYFKTPFFDFGERVEARL